MYGSVFSVWLTICAVARTLKLNNETMQCAVRRRLGLVINVEGVDKHGHYSLAENSGGRLDARPSGMLAA